MLALVGPVLLPATIAVWFIELVVGFGLIYLPFGDALSGPGSQQTDGWVASLYVSIHSATTLGVGDIYPASSALRFLATIEAALGFVLLSTAITYALSVYGALLHSTALAFEMTSFIGLTRARFPGGSGRGTSTAAAAGHNGVDREPIMVRRLRGREVCSDTS